ADLEVGDAAVGIAVVGQEVHADRPAVGVQHVRGVDVVVGRDRLEQRGVRVHAHGEGRGAGELPVGDPVQDRVGAGFGGGDGGDPLRGAVLVRGQHLDVGGRLDAVR